MSKPFRYSEIRDAVANASRLFVASDFDGTLCTLASSPELVQVTDRTRQVLEQLAQSPDVVLAILSGRRMEDVQAKAGIPAIYGGNHGLEITGPNLNFLHPEAATFGMKLKTLSVEIGEAIAPWPEAWIENKRWSVTVHMRPVAIQEWPSIQRAVTLAVNGLNDNTFKLRDAHAAVEVIPGIEWDKGSAVRYLRRELGLESALIVCLGDDTTDETMFEALPDGVTIRVGKKENTHAAYYVDDVEKATEVLEKIASDFQDYGKTSTSRSISSGLM